MCRVAQMNFGMPTILVGMTNSCLPHRGLYRGLYLIQGYVSFRFDIILCVITFLVYHARWRSLNDDPDGQF